MLFLVALLASQPPPPAESAEALRILVVAPGVDDPGRVDELYAGLRAAGLLSVEADERAGVDREAQEPPPAGVLDEARAKLAEARARFRDLELDAAREAVDATIDETLRLERPELAVEVLADALLLRAHLALQSGADDDAREALLLVARLEPAREALNAGLYPPSLVDAYAAARAASLEAPSAILDARPRVAGFEAAELLVDGRPAPLGRSPQGAGPHLVTLRATGPAGIVPESRIVVLEPDESLVLEPFLGPRDVAARRRAAVEAAGRAADDPTLAAALAEVASLSAARAVLFVPTGDEATRAALFVPDRGVERLTAAAGEPGTDIGRATLAALQAPARRDEGLPPRVADDGVPWVPFAVGGGVAALLVVTGIVVVALLPPPTPTPTAQPVVVNGFVD